MPVAVSQYRNGALRVLRRFTAASCALSLIVGVNSCSNVEARSDFHANPDDIPTRIQIPGSRITVGFHRGTRRTQVDVKGYSITVHPISARDYTGPRRQLRFPNH